MEREIVLCQSYTKKGFLALARNDNGYRVGPRGGCKQSEQTLRDLLFFVLNLLVNLDGAVAGRNSDGGKNSQRDQS